MMVPFATTCDHAGCGKRSLEYVAYPTCIYCDKHSCPAHTRPGTLREDEAHNDCICSECKTTLDPEETAS